MERTVREPIQTYLTAKERAELDRVANERGVSRSEVLRQGVHALGQEGRSLVLRDLVERGIVTAPATGPGAPPPSAPVAPIDELLTELSEDRAQR